MAAAPDYLLHASRETSPELALVDAALAAELRQTLRVPSEIDVRPQLVAVDEGPVEPTLADELIIVPDAAPLVAPVSVEVSDEAPTEAALADDPILEPTEHLVWPAVPDAPEPMAPAASPADELIIFPDAPTPAAPVAVHEDDAVPPPASEHDGDEPEEPDDVRSDYPVLPALDARTTEETDAVLRRIREQIATAEPRARRRRVRRSFVVASGLAAACAIAAVVTEIQLGFVQGL